MTTTVCPHSPLAPFGNAPGHQMLKHEYAEFDTLRCYRCKHPDTGRLRTVAPSVFGDKPCPGCGQEMRPVMRSMMYCTCGWNKPTG